MSDEPKVTESVPKDAEGSPKRRRRRRKRRRSQGPSSGEVVSSANLESITTTTVQRGRRTAIEIEGSVVSLPSSGKNPYHKRSSRPQRKQPGSTTGRKRRLKKIDIDELKDWLTQMPDFLVCSLYRGLGGQPKRVTSHDRMIQLSVRAIGQGSRLSNLIQQLNEKSKKALGTLLQAGGIAHHEELHRELVLSFGGREKEWERTMVSLANRGVVFASPDQDGHYFYLVPSVLIDGLLEEMKGEFALPVFEHDDMKVTHSSPFCPPLDFSVTTLATYIAQKGPRLSQRQEIYRTDKEEMDAFFSQIWSGDSELFGFHLDFLMMHGMVELHGEYLSLNHEVVEQWLQSEPEDQRDLFFSSLNKRFPMAEWVLWAIQEAGDDWVAEGPLVGLYRRWVRGEDWRDRYSRKQYATVRTHDRQSYSFAPLVRSGLLEMGQWGQEKFYRLSPRGKHLLSPPKDDGFSLFYLTPSFEIMAPAGLAPILLFRIGELSELTGCDRANTYKITQPSIESAISHGWTRDDTLQFLRDNSQIGLPDNVETTLKGWIGSRGDVQFQDAFIMTVHRSQIRKLEGIRNIKPYILHRFGPGLYAVDKSRLNELNDLLKERGFDPFGGGRTTASGFDQTEARQHLNKLITEARDAVMAPSKRSAKLITPSQLRAVPGTKLDAEPKEALGMPAEVTTEEAKLMLDDAIATGADVEMIYTARTGERVAYTVQPERMAFKSDSPVLVGLDRGENERRTYIIDRIERMRKVIMS